MSRQTFDEDFKRSTVQMMIEQNKSVAQTARDLDINPNTIYNWKKKYGEEFIEAALPNMTENQQLKAMQKRLRDLEEENAILKKANALLRERPSVIFSFIFENRFKFRVEKMCNVMNVSRSGYHKWVDRPESEKTKRHKTLVKHVHKSYLESRGLYGSPKIAKDLEKKGIPVCQKTVARIMKEEDLRSKTVKKYKATTNSKHTLPVYENKLNQEFKVDEPNKVWVADITYVPTSEGWLYLASVMDLFSRKIVGWSVDKTMTKDLVINALDRAYNRQQRPLGSVLHHSDCGSQYCSKDYQKQLAAYKIDVSMSRKGNCYDNACIESFHSVLKKELIYLTKYKTREQAKKEIYEYIEIFYNSKRIHSANGYFSPSDYERMYFDKIAN
ncbi:IS3 family transposase [Bacillus massiliglaciei]|uniref:IS3 family transposase n=1 Tax=Bacillus massiliglaciei TaxID=1816693 RepID=UPI000DA61BF2|nr:IS3 family transposase [Bacillus massiliglaciei]